VCRLNNRIICNVLLQDEEFGIEAVVLSAQQYVYCTVLFYAGPSGRAV